MADSEIESPVQSLFTHFRSELDQHHDRRERVIKASRDITALSKKIIFSLQRVRDLNAPIPKGIAKENGERFKQIKDLFTSIVPDVSGINAWRYQSQVWGIQEYIEALSFHYYIEKKQLITIEEVKGSLPAEILVTESDYLLGLFDLTGELMRFAITAMGTGGNSARPTPSNANFDGPSDERAKASPTEGIMVDLRALRAMFERLDVPRKHPLSSKDFAKKMEVMQTSVEKVEKAAYGLIVRGKERPDGWMPDLSSGAVPVESY